MRLERLIHRDQPVIAIHFEKDWELIGQVKKLGQVRFSGTKSFWYVPDTPGCVDQIRHAFEGLANVDEAALKNMDRPQTKDLVPEKLSDTPSGKDLNEDQMRVLRMSEQKLNLKGYSVRTKKTYLEQLKLFMRFYISVHPIELSEIEIRNYLLYVVEKKKLGRSSQNQAINSIKFFVRKSF